MSERFIVWRTTTDSGRSRIWGAYDTLHIFPAMRFSKGTNEENRALAERAVTVLNFGSWADKAHLSEGQIARLDEGV